jgi:nicotinate-nucleotide adenylyltransferase
MTAAPERPAGPRPPIVGRLGILGGTFDPIHLAHLAIAEEAREALGLERVLFVPAGLPWQKVDRVDRVVTPAADRLARVELAVAGNVAFAVSSIEVDRPGPSYTVDTLATLADETREDGREPDLWFILSAEALSGLPTWRDAERLLELSHVAVVPRADVSDAATPAADAEWLAATYPHHRDRVVFLDRPRLGLSSSAIRDRVAAGRSIRYLVPDAVTAYIGDHGLYRGQPTTPMGSVPLVERKGETAKRD